MAKIRKNENRNIYAVYKGDEYLMDGTIREIAISRGIKEKSVKFFLTPAYKRRKTRQDLNRKKKSPGYITLTIVEDMEAVL